MTSTEVTNSSLQEASIQSFRIEQIDIDRQKLIVIFLQSKREQIISEKTSELEQLLQQDAIDVQLIKVVIDRVENTRCKQKMPVDFDITQIPTNPLLKQLQAIILKSYDAPFLRDDYELLQKIYLYILHIQDLKAAAKQRLEAGLDVPRYYRTDIVSRERIRDNREHLQKLMAAFERAAFTDETISPTEWMDEVSRDEYYKERRKNIFTMLDDKENSESPLTIINTGLAHKELKTELNELFGDINRGARHYLTNYQYTRQEDEKWYREQEEQKRDQQFQERHGYSRAVAEELRDLAIHISLGRSVQSPRHQELQSLHSKALQDNIQYIAKHKNDSHTEKVILEYQLRDLAQRTITDGSEFSAEDLQLQANHAQELENHIQEIHQTNQRAKERDMHDKAKQKELDRDGVSENIYKQLKIIEYYFLNRLDIKTQAGDKITFSDPMQIPLSVDGLLYFRDHQEKDMTQRFLDRMHGREQESPLFLKGLQITDLTYGALEAAIKQLEDKDIAPILGSLLRYKALPRLEDK